LTIGRGDMKREKFINKIFERILSDKIKERSERVILFIAIISYVVHLILILLASYDVVQIDSKLFKSPISAIYTPFSFILVYEVYLLIFYLPKSISYYIGKQYEIITLIVIRRIFKDIGNLELTSKWVESQDDLQFTYDTITSLILFLIIYYFYQNIKKRDTTEDETGYRIDRDKLAKFIGLKKAIAILLVPLLLALAGYTFFVWVNAAVSNYENGVIAFKNLNNIFFDEFFTVLIIVDVLLLLTSFFHSDRFHKIIRNSGFIISTILIKMSFSTDGIGNNTLIIGAVVFGFLILLIHNKFEKKSTSEVSS